MLVSEIDVQGGGGTAEIEFPGPEEKCIHRHEDYELETVDTSYVD